MFLDEGRKKEKEITFIKSNPKLENRRQDVKKSLITSIAKPEINVVYTLRNVRNLGRSFLCY